MTQTTVKSGPAVAHGRFLEVQITRLLEFLGLKWEPACLEFHRNRRPVRTASSDQVRQRMYRSSVGRHRNYNAHLADFFALLQAGGDG